VAASSTVGGTYQVKPSLPFTPGLEAAGEMTETGSGVTALRTEWVLAVLRNGGGCAEEIRQAVGEIDPGGAHPDADFARPQRARGDVLQPQHVGRAQAWHNIAFIQLFFGLASRLRYGSCQAEPGPMEIRLARHGGEGRVRGAIKHTVAGQSTRMLAKSAC
jgi:hypothetical protein